MDIVFVVIVRLVRSLFLQLLSRHSSFWDSCLGSRKDSQPSGWISLGKATCLVSALLSPRFRRIPLDGVVVVRQEFSTSLMVGYIISCLSSN